MKKLNLILPILLVAITITAFKTKDGIDVINYYDENQSKTYEELLAQTYENSKTPIVYFYADWCGPCKSFKKSWSDKRVQKSLENATLIKINVDVDASKDEIYAKYGVRAIPNFVKVDKNGKAIAQITSDKWKKGVPKNIAPVMDKLINTSTYDK